jgi:Ca2+-binding EF-hand superfamily protein
MKQTSKPVPNQSSGSRQGSKKVETSSSKQGSKKVEKQIVSQSDGDEIKNAFEFFDSNGNGKIDAREIKYAMQNIGYDERDPSVFQVVNELDNPRNKNTGGVSFNDFCQTVNNRIPEKETTEDLRKVFSLFLDDPNSSTTTLASIKRVADELGENFDEAELNAMLNKASKYGAELTFEDFAAIMSSGQNL